MRLKPLDKEVRVFMAPSELQTYLQSCQRRIAIGARIEARTSARRGIVVGLERRDFFIPDHPDVDLAFVRLRETKDPTEGENALNGQVRISWVPWSLYEDIQQYCDDEGIGPDEEIIDIGYRQYGNLIEDAAKDAAVATGNSDYEHIRSHDFRAFYATHMIRRLGVDKHVVMEMGGWGSEKAIEPYLASSLPRDLQDSLVRAGAVEKDVGTPQRQDALGEILERLTKIETALELDTVVDDVGEISLSEVRKLKQTAEGLDENSEADETKPSSLNEFMGVMSPAGVACYGALIGAHRSVTRASVERRAMATDPVALSPTLGAAVYSMALLLLFLATMTASGSVESIDIVAVAFGAVIGSGQFDFDTPAGQEFQTRFKS